MSTLTRRHFVHSTAASLATLAAARVSPAAAPTRPNIVFVLADQWRASAFGHTGDPNVKTPCLDRLASRSLRFRNTVSVLPVCTPYRAALMTGRFPTSTGMFLNDLYLPDEELCLAEVFQQAGYSTAYIGKWHLDGHGRSAFIPPRRRQGWDYWKGAECDHNYQNSHYYQGTSDEKKFWDGYDAFAQTKDAQQYLRDPARSQKPFILFVSYGTPHFPHNNAPKQYNEMYPPDQIKLPPNVPESFHKEARAELQGYYAHCTALDQCVGDLLTTLDETKLADNTLFVFTSDHGDMMGSHGIPPKLKHMPYSESALVPFLLRCPFLHGAAGRVIDTPVTTPDLFATLLGLAGLPIPASAEGQDLSSVVRGQAEIPGRAALYMNVSPFIGRHCNEYRALRTARHTYVRALEGPSLLFDDQADPHQLTNLVARPECAALVKDLDARLQSELQRIGDTFHPRDYYLRRWNYSIAPHGSIDYRPGSRPQSPRPMTNP